MTCACAKPPTARSSIFIAASIRRFRSARCTTWSMRSNAGCAGASRPSGASSATPSRGVSAVAFNWRAKPLHHRRTCAPKNPAPSACKIIAHPIGSSRPSNSTCRSIRPRRRSAPSSRSSPTRPARRRRWCLTARSCSSARSPRRQAAGSGKFRRHAGPADDRAGTEPAVRVDNRNCRRPDRKYATHGAVPRRRDLLHAVRGGRVSAHHLFPRPAGRDGGLYHAHRSRQERSRGAAFQRQSHRPRRRAGHVAAFRRLA